MIKEITCILDRLIYDCWRTDTEEAKMRDRPRQAANILGGLLQAASPGWAFATGIGRPIWEQSDLVVTPATPATYAFTIWSFIFLTSLVYGVYQALPGKGQDPLLRRIGWFSAAAFLLNACWGVAQQTQGVSWLTVILIFMILAASAAAFFPVAITRGLGTTRTLCVALPLGVLAGWITAASPVNIDQALASHHIALFGISATGQSIATICISAALSAGMLIVMRGNLIFTAAPLWALVGIVVASLTRVPNHPVAIVAGSLAILLACVAIIVRRRTDRHSR